MQTTCVFHLVDCKSYKFNNFETNKKSYFLLRLVVKSNFLRHFIIFSKLGKNSKKFSIFFLILKGSENWSEENINLINQYINWKLENLWKSVHNYFNSRLNFYCFYRVDACEAKVEIVTPYWFKNSAGKVRAIVNTEHFEQAIHQEVCSYVFFNLIS